MLVDYVRIDRSEMEETGEYNLQGLFIRRGLAVDTVQAKRVVMDAIETLLAGLQVRPGAVFLILVSLALACWAYLGWSRCSRNLPAAKVCRREDRAADSAAHP